MEGLINDHYNPTKERINMTNSDSERVFHHDMEISGAADAHLLNTTVRNISWEGVEVTVRDRETKQPKSIVQRVDGLVEAGTTTLLLGFLFGQEKTNESPGEICALMGPSGCGKTTLLNVLAGRPTNASSVEGSVLVNGVKPSRSEFRQISCFVEQEDALIGSLTVRETLLFTSRLSSTSSLPRKERLARIDGLLAAFGLDEQANTIIGTPIRKGISGGQKRRAGVASQLITSPKIMFLDEPTSGLDSAASFEVISYLKTVARRSNVRLKPRPSSTTLTFVLTGNPQLVVVASIHQPSTSTFNLFDKLLLLSGGKTHYFGAVERVVPYYESMGMPMPLQVNPAEHLLEVVNVDFVKDKRQAAGRLEAMHQSWNESGPARDLKMSIADARQKSSPVVVGAEEGKPGLSSLVLTLLHRSFIKSYRDVVAYGIRFAMYTGMFPLRTPPERAAG